MIEEEFPFTLLSSVEICVACVSVVVEIVLIAEVFPSTVVVRVLIDCALFPDVVRTPSIRDISPPRSVWSVEICVACVSVVVDIWDIVVDCSSTVVVNVSRLVV